MMSITPPAIGFSSTNFVELAGLSKVYGPPTATIQVLRGLNLTIPQGERVALLGKSGSGKSTLLNLLGGLDVPTSGTIRVGGRDLATMQSNDRADYRLSMVGMIFQAFHLVASRTALENVEMPMTLAGVSKVERRQRAAECLDAVGMSHRLTHFPAQLSGGERQRVAIARALVNRPRLLLADEPTGNLDTATGDEVLRLILEYVHSRGATLLLVTHEEELARQCATRILRMQDGILRE
ncbi:MAG: ABC transporter ATP-binding protein [Planctomycetes bacterium]|nr:ABC transporter ATP-binding protein [Planctomycetota bacterium]